MGSAEVDAFLEAAAHPRTEEIQLVRRVILGLGLTEHLKWNAPSFCSGGEDRVTMRLQPKDRLELIFHRGAKKRAPDGFTFADASGLLTFVAYDRAVVVLTDADDTQTKAPVIGALVAAWCAAVAN